MNATTGVTAVPRDTKMRYQQFPDEETCAALAEMRAYYTESGTTPTQVFKDIDEKNAGSLTYWEFYKGFKAKGYKFDQRVAEKLMGLLDRDGVGRVDVREFDKVFGHLEYKDRKKEQIEEKANPPRNVWDQVVDKLAGKKDRLTDTIMALDTDKSGKLSYWEFSQGLKKLGLRLDKHQVETLLAALDKDGDGEVSVGEFVTGVIGQISLREAAAAKEAEKGELGKRRAVERDARRKEFEEQQQDAIAAAKLSAYEVRTAWNKVNKAISGRGTKNMNRLFDEFDTDGGGTVDRKEFRAGLAAIGVRLSGAEFEACWQYADPRGEGALSRTRFVEGLGEIDPEVDQQSAAHDSKAIDAKQRNLARLKGAAGDDGKEGGAPVELHETWLELCKYFGKGKARALATFKQIDIDGGGTLDRQEFRIFTAMLNLHLTDRELDALWAELDADDNGTLSFLELQRAVGDREKLASEEKQAKDRAKGRAEKAAKASLAELEAVVETADLWEAACAFLDRNGEASSRAFFLGFDSTGHGTLSREEFRNALMAGPKVDVSDEALFNVLWGEVDLTGHNEVEFKEVWEAIHDAKAKADAVIAGTWLPEAKDKQKDLIKRETARRKAAEKVAAAKDVASRLRAEKVQAKRGKVAKVTGNEQIKLKAVQMLKRRQAIAKAKQRASGDLGVVQFERTRRAAGLAIFFAALQYYLSWRVYYVLEGTGEYARNANGLIVIAALWGVVTSLTQHWLSVAAFFVLTFASLLGNILNILTNLNTWVFLTQVATDCFAPPETARGKNFCYDDFGKTELPCVCTDRATLQCYAFTPGVDAFGCSPQKDAGAPLMMAAIGGFLTFAATLSMWSTVGCFAPLWTQQFGWYYVVFAQHELKAHLHHKKKAAAEQRGSAMLEYQKKKKASKALKGFEELVGLLKQACDDQGGAQAVFKSMDAAGSGKADQLAFRGGLQALGIKAAAADVNKLWDLMDSDHAGVVSFADFSSGLKIAERVLGDGASGGGGGAGGGDVEEGGVGSLLLEKAAAKEACQAAWDKVHAAMARSQLEPAAFFETKLDADHAGDLDQGDLEEALGSLGLVLLDEQLAALWTSILVPPSDYVNAEDYANAARKNPPTH